MAAGQATAFQKSFPLDPDVLGPGSSGTLDIAGTTDADVVQAIASNSAFPTRPTGVIDLAHISFQASGGNPVFFTGGGTTVGFRFSAGVTAAAGVFDDPQ